MIFYLAWIIYFVVVLRRFINNCSYLQLYLDLYFPYAIIYAPFTFLFDFKFDMA